MSLALTMTPSVPPSPTTPSRKRRSLRLSHYDSNQDVMSPSPYTSGTTNGTSFSRRSSRTSQTSFQPQSPTSARPPSQRSHRPSFHNRRKSSSRLSIGSNISFEQIDGSGLGNLADELEGAWDQDSVDLDDDGFLEGLREGESISALNSPTSLYNPYDDEHSPQLHSPSKRRSLQLPQVKSPKKHNSDESNHRKTESMYDGSDYGPDSDEEGGSIPPSLSRRLRDIEDITRISMNADAVSEDGGVLRRTTNALKDLGPQSNIEYGIGRLITAYASMTTHRTHQTRELFNQTHSLLYQSLFDLSEDTIDLLIVEIEKLAHTTPFLQQQKQNPLVSLQTIASQTSELAYTLRSLTDVLQESRISSATATRKLKSVKEMVEELRDEEELMETSMMLIQAGDWDRRCKERQAAKSCREVIEGFGHRWGVDMDETAWPLKNAQVSAS